MTKYQENFIYTTSSIKKLLKQTEMTSQSKLNNASKKRIVLMLTNERLLLNNS